MLKWYLKLYTLLYTQTTMNALCKSCNTAWIHSIKNSLMTSAVNHSLLCVMNGRCCFVPLCAKWVHTDKFMVRVVGQELGSLQFVVPLCNKYVPYLLPTLLKICLHGYRMKKSADGKYTEVRVFQISYHI
jgi:hypothetical protein